MKTIKHFKILFFNVDKKNRFILKEFKQNPSNKLEFLNSLISFEGFNVTNKLFINLFYKKYLDIFTEVTKKSPKDYNNNYWGTTCLDINYKSSTNEYFKSRGFSIEETKLIRKKKYATSSIKFQMDKHNIKEDDAINKIKGTQKIIKEKRQSTYKKYIEENPNYWKETVGYGVESLIKNKGLSLEEATILHKSISKNVSEKNKQWAIDQSHENPEYWNSRLDNQEQYWIGKGYSEVEAKEKIKERQTTFTLEKCINKHGEVIGAQIFNKRQKDWLISLYKNFEEYGDGRSPQSKWVNNIKDILKNHGVNIPDKEKWIRESNPNSKAYSFDLTIRNKIIEFNGDYWHMNPNKYNGNKINKTKKMTASEIWQYDLNKIKLAELHGYKVLTVWESEYNKNPEETILKCINFINN